MTRVPDLVVTVDGQRFTGPEAAVGAAAVEVGLGSAIDAARLVLGTQSPIAGLAPDAEIEIELGYDGDTTTVLTGLVTTVARRAGSVAVEAFAAAVKLARLRIARSYLAQSAADIVQDLIAEAGAEAGEVDVTPVLAAYHVDARRSAWAHVQDLASLSGSDVSSAPDGKIHFKSAAGGLGGATLPALPGGGLRYGADIVHFDVAATAPAGAVATVVPFGAASASGGEKWHIVLREPEGSSPQGQIVIAAALRDQDAAERLAAALEAAAARRVSTARVAVVGDPAIRAGDPVDLADLPEVAPPSLRVVTVTHRYTAGGGFASMLELEAAA